MEDLGGAVAEAQIEREQSAAGDELAQLRAAGQKRLAELEATGENPQTGDQIMEQLRERSNAEFAHQDQLAVKEATPTPSPDEIKARGDMPASVLVREAWDASAAGATHVLDATGYVVAGLFDVVKNLGSGMASFDEQLRKYGVDYTPEERARISMKEDRVVPANEPLTIVGGMGQMIQKKTDALEPWVSDTWEHDNPLRKITQAVAAYALTKRFTQAAGIQNGMISLGRAATSSIAAGSKAAKAASWAGATGMEAFHAGVAQAWGMAEDETLVAGLESLGIPRSAVLEYLDSSEDNTEFENRVKNAVTTALGGGAFDATLGLSKWGIKTALAPAVQQMLRLNKYVRNRLRGVADKAEELGDPSLTETIRATQERNAITHDQLIAILGDPGLPMYVKEGARGAGVSNPLAPLRSVKSLLTPEEAMDSVLTRAESALPNAARKGAAPEALEDRINWARIDGPEDIPRAMSDFQQGFEGEINQAVGGKRTLAAVEADAKELDGWALVNEGVRTGEALQDAELLAVRNFYILSLRKFMDVAKLHRANPTDATRAAGAKLLNIVRDTQRIVRRESARASRNLGALRIPAREAQGYELHKQLGELMPELDAKDMDTVLEAVANASGKKNSAAVANMALNLDGIKLAGRAVSKEIKNLYYFSMLSRFTTHIRNAIGSPLFFALRMAEMKVANQLGHLVSGEPAVYDGEVTAHVQGFMKGMAEAFRLPELVDSLEDGAAAAVSRDSKAAAAAVDRFSNAMDGGVYRAFMQNKSSFGGSQIADAAQTGPLFGTTPSHIWGYSTEANVGRALALLHAVTVRGPRAVVSTPGRALNAMDELFKTANQRAEIRGIAFRQAYNEVKAGMIPADQLTARVEHLAANPNTGMLFAGEEAARAGTFTARPTGPYGKWMEQTHNLPFLGPLIVPFSRAPSNITWEMLRRTPLGVLPQVDSFLSDVTSKDPRVRDLAWSRMLVGNMAILGAMDFFMDGDRVQIVGDVAPKGGPAESQQRRRNFLDPMTIRVSTNPDGGFEDGKFVEIPIRGYDPVTFPLVIAGNLLQHMEQGAVSEKEFSTEEQVMAYTSALASVLTSQTSLRSVRDFFTAMGENRAGEFLMNQVPTIPTPGATEQFVPFYDDVYRETFSMMDTVRSQTPGLSNSLPAARDAWGFVKKRLPGWQGMLQSMIPRGVNVETDIQPIDLWVMKRGFFIGEPSKEVATFRQGVKVPWHRYPEAYEEYKRLAGHGLVAPERMRDIVVQGEAGNILKPPAKWVSATDGGLVGELNLLAKGTHPKMQKIFDRLPDDDARMNFIRQAISFYQGAAREKLLQDERFADLAAEVQLKKRAEMEQQKDPMRRQRLSFGFGADLRGRGSE